MPSQVKLTTIDDVANDEDLLRYYETHRRLLNYLSHQLAMAAASVKAMLRVHDKRPGGRAGRAARVARPLALAAAALILVSKYVTISARRFSLEYDEEITARRGRRRTSRPFTFGG